MIKLESVSVHQCRLCPPLWSLSFLSWRVTIPKNIQVYGDNFQTHSFYPFVLKISLTIKAVSWISPSDIRASSLLSSSELVSPVDHPAVFFFPLLRSMLGSRFCFALSHSQYLLTLDFSFAWSSDLEQHAHMCTQEQKHAHIHTVFLDLPNSHRITQ